MTWEWRTLLGQPAVPPPQTDPPTLDEIRIAHNAAIERNDAKAAAALRARIQSALDLRRGATFDGDTTLLGGVQHRGARRGLTLYFVAGKFDVDGHFKVHAKVLRPPRLSTLPADPADLELASGPIWPTTLWRKGHIYRFEIIYRKRPGTEVLTAAWSPGPRRTDNAPRAPRAASPVDPTCRPPRHPRPRRRPARPAPYPPSARSPAPPRHPPPPRSRARAALASSLRAPLRLRAFSGAWAAFPFRAAAHAPEKAHARQARPGRSAASGPRVTGIARDRATRRPAAASLTLRGCTYVSPARVQGARTGAKREQQSGCGSVATRRAWGKWRASTRYPSDSSGSGNQRSSTRAPAAIDTTLGPTTGSVHQRDALALRRLVSQLPHALRELADARHPEREVAVQLVADHRPQAALGHRLEDLEARVGAQLAQAVRAVAEVVVRLLVQAELERRRQDQEPVGRQHAAHLGDQRPGARRVLEDLHAEHRVEAPSRNGSVPPP